MLDLQLPIIPNHDPTHFLLSQVENLSDVQHAIWSHWMEYLFSMCVDNPDGSKCIPSGLVERWSRQLETKYVDLSESEKDADRQEAIRIISWLAQST